MAFVAKMQDLEDATDERKNKSETSSERKGVQSRVLAVVKMSGLSCAQLLEGDVTLFK
jgi:hypothetical protein